MGIKIKSIELTKENLQIIREGVHDTNESTILWQHAVLDSYNGGNELYFGNHIEHGILTEQNGDEFFLAIGNSEPISLNIDGTKFLAEKLMEFVESKNETDN